MIQIKSMVIVKDTHRFEDAAAHTQSTAVDTGEKNVSVHGASSGLSRGLFCSRCC